jgi:hypothetical protein
MSKHECACGAVYSNLDALLACQNANHGLPRFRPMAAGFITQETDGGMLIILQDKRNREIAQCLVRRDDFPHFAALFRQEKEPCGKQ